MNKFVKILIAVALLGGLLYMGISTYIENKRIEEDTNAALMDMLIEKNEEENENEKIVYEDVTDADKIEKIEEYISRMYLEFPGGNVLPEFSDVEAIEESYVEHLVFLNTDLVLKESEETEKVYYTYPELNRVAVQLLGKNVHNKFPDKTSEYFEKTTDGFSVIGMCGSESEEYKYVLDNIQVASNGLYYIDMYEYIKSYGVISPDVTIEDDGKKLNILDVNEEEVLDYTLEILPYSEIEVTIKYLDSEGNEVTDEMIEEDVKENLDKFVKRKIILEYDEELDLYYMKSNIIEK